jgi:hypothetical protein
MIDKFKLLKSVPAKEQELIELAILKVKYWYWRTKI